MSLDFDAQGMAAQARAIAQANADALAANVVTGFTPSNMAAWNRAKARVRAGVGDAIVACVGDSTFVGHGAGDNPTGNFTNARFRSSPARVAAQLVAMGLPATQEAQFGGHMVDANNVTLANLPLYNPQLTIASSVQTQWYGATLLTIAGYMISNLNGTGAYSLTPTNAFDTIDVYYVQASGNGTFTVDIGGAALATINSGSPATSAVIKVSVSTGAGAATGTINVKRVSGTVRLLGIIPRSTTTRRVQILNLGWEGAQTGDWASDAGSATYSSGLSSSFYNPANALGTLGPDLTEIKLGANDLSHSTPIAASRANLQTIITAAKLGGGSCMLIAPTPQDPVTRDPLGNTLAYNAMVKALALANGCGFIDLYSRYVSYASMNALGYLADVVHSLPIGYANEGDIIARALHGS